MDKVAAETVPPPLHSEQFTLALEAAPTGMLLVDHRGQIVFVNARIEHMFGYERHELIGASLEQLVPLRFRERHPHFRESFFAAPQTRAMGTGRDLYALRKDGSEMPVEIGLNPLSTSGGMFVLGSVVDITERKRHLEQLRERTEELSSRLQERDVLLMEIHHRVKNNLQVIASLINMQARKIENAAVRDAFKECKNRVDAIALIHEQLYQSRDFAKVPFSDYASTLAQSVVQATEGAAESAALDVQVERISLAVDRAIPCGLILNELITNSLKHAFTDGRHGTVRVSLARIPGERIRLQVSDNGVGMAPDRPATDRPGMGQQLIAALANQLNGSLDIDCSNGTTVSVEFPERA